MKRTSTAIWEGSGKEGSGNLSSQSEILNNTPYSFSSRFEEGSGTNPEELIAAAHAGCFAMKLSFILGAAGYTPDKLEAKCEVTLDDGAITSSQITLNASVPGIDEDTFAKSVKDAEENCPISKVLSTNISVDYTLS
ncbi:MAG: OsmC family peroxiredoxin [Bacteroidetes bacterium]|nr:MAG: OsmC family peroxiredoxin [Bacteroidota bacterium]